MKNYVFTLIRIINLQLGYWILEYNTTIIINNTVNIFVHDKYKNTPAVPQLTE